MDQISRFGKSLTSMFNSKSLLCGPGTFIVMFRIFVLKNKQTRFYMNLYVLYRDIEKQTIFMTWESGNTEQTKSMMMTWDPGNTEKPLAVYEAGLRRLCSPEHCNPAFVGYANF